jgi:hypothetical protein
MIQTPAANSDSIVTDDFVSARLEAAILGLLATRAAGATICPSEAARAVASESDVNWRPLMAATRLAALRLATAGRIDITQRGRCVDVTQVRGPVRLRLRAVHD